MKRTRRIYLGIKYFGKQKRQDQTKPCLYNQFFHFFKLKTCVMSKFLHYSSLTKKIINRHGGEIWVEAAEQEGAAFYFDLERSEQ